MVYILRRRKLGATSCREISKLSTTGITVVRSDRPLPKDPDELVIRWGCTANVPQKNVVNIAAAIHEVNDKRAFRMLLEEHKLGPKTWFDLIDVPFTHDLALHPLVVRPARHAQGRNFYTPENRPQLGAICHRLGHGNYYISEFVDKVAEYRVFVVNGRVACVANKIPGNPKDRAWNVARGGKFENVRWDEWPLRAARVSVQAMSLTSLDFGGVDVMVDAVGAPYVLEINSAPSLTSPYRQECMTKCLDYIVRNGKGNIPMTDKKGNYRKFIHPAVCPGAILV